MSVDTVDEVPDMIRRLQRDPVWAESIAKAGQERMARMDVDEVRETLGSDQIRSGC